MSAGLGVLPGGVGLELFKPGAPPQEVVRKEAIAGLKAGKKESAMGPNLLQKMGRKKRSAMGIFTSASKKMGRMSTRVPPIFMFMGCSWVLTARL